MSGCGGEADRRPCQVLMQGSSSALIKTLLPAPPSNAPTKKATLGGYFKRSLLELMALINATSPHWIRCIKPHALQRPQTFKGPFVLQQLTSAGVLGTVRVRKAGYPIRLPLERFWQRFRLLCPAPPPQGLGGRCCRIVEEVMRFPKAIAQVPPRALRPPIGQQWVMDPADPHQCADALEEGEVTPRPPPPGPPAYVQPPSP